jgi:putative transposase
LRYNRTNPAIIAYGIYMYFNSRSYRCTSKSLEYIIRRSHVSIWKWVQKNANVADCFRIYKHGIKEIFVDETLIQIDGKDYWLWIAYEPNIKRCLMMHISRERTILVCYQFFKQLRNRFGRKTIFTDGATWYYQVCRWLRMKHYIYESDLKNKMERFVQKIKDRTECFDDHFPCTKDDCNRLHVYNWLKLYILYIHTDMDKTKFMELLMDGG